MQKPTTCKINGNIISKIADEIKHVLFCNKNVSYKSCASVCWGEDWKWKSTQNENDRIRKYTVISESVVPSSITQANEQQSIHFIYLLSSCGYVSGHPMARKRSSLMEKKYINRTLFKADRGAHCSLLYPELQIHLFMLQLVSEGPLTPHAGRRFLKLCKGLIRQHAVMRFSKPLKKSVLTL